MTKREREIQRALRRAKLKQLPPMEGKTKAEREYNLYIHGSEKPIWVRRTANG